VAGDHDADDDTIDGNDTSEDDREDTLHNELGLHDTHGADTDGCLGSSVSASDAGERHGEEGAHSAEERRVEGAQIGSLINAAAAARSL